MLIAGERGRVAAVYLGPKPPTETDTLVTFWGEIGRLISLEAEFGQTAITIR